jgi:hypothetical protein
VPTEDSRRQVEQLAAYGLKQDMIAKVIGISDVTLRAHYAHELEVGLARTIEKVANSLVEKAVSDRADAVNAAKFFLQSQGGWKERIEQDVITRPEDRHDAVRDVINRRKAARANERPVH